MKHREKLLRLLLFSLLLYALWHTAATRLELQRLREKEESLEARAELLETENAQWRQALAVEGDRETLERLARERLGFVAPGELVFMFESGG